MSDEPKRSIEVCPECGGDGCLAEHPDVAPSGEIRCPRCEGVGRLGVNPECRLCNGLGFIADCPACLEWDGEPAAEPHDEIGVHEKLRRLQAENAAMRALLVKAQSQLRISGTFTDELNLPKVTKAFNSAADAIAALLAEKKNV